MRPGADREPDNARDVIRWVEAGRLTPAEALGRLRRLDGRPAPPSGLRAPEDHVQTAEHVWREIDSLVGLKEVKRQIREIWAFVEIQRRRGAVGLATEAQTLHMIFRGAPGTGKTTVARLVGRLFAALDVLPKGHLVEVERADLVGEYIGHTAQKTREVIRRAMGGVMFVDEAYSLARGGEKDFGKEAIDTLVKAMEDHKSEFLLILAGYPREMASFLAANPGLYSRFPIHLDFPDYSPQELMLITEQMVRQREYRLTEEARLELMRYWERRHAFWPENAGNARLVRNLVERAVRRQAVRLLHRGGPISRDDLMTLVWGDFEENR
jgi:stage V sporulation protein K